MLSVYVIVAVPALTPVTKPFVFTVATAPLLEVHGLLLAAVPLPVKLVVDPTHTDSVPLIIGSGVMVTVWVLLQPSESV